MSVSNLYKTCFCPLKLINALFLVIKAIVFGFLNIPKMVRTLGIAYWVNDVTGSMDHSFMVLEECLIFHQRFDVSGSVQAFTDD